MNDYLDMYVEYKVKSNNERLQHVKAIIRGYIERIDKFDKQTVRQFMAIRKSMREVVDNEYNLRLINEWKSLSRKLKKFDTEMFRNVKKAIKENWEFDSDDIGLVISDSDLEGILEGFDFRAVKEVAKMYLRKLQIKNHFEYDNEYDDEFDIRVLNIVPWKKSDNRLKIVIYGLKNNEWITFPNGIIRYYPDANSKRQLTQLLDLMKEKYPEVQTFMDTTPEIILNNCANSYGTIDTCHLFNKTAKIIDTETFKPEYSPVSNCRKCNGPMYSNYKCEKCDLQYCSKCMSVMDDDHVCKQSDLDEWKLILQTTKPCPVCGNRIDKSVGCNDMFCNNCTNGFKWDTSEIIEGSFHNPERALWLRKIQRDEKYLSLQFRQFSISDVYDFIDAMRDAACFKNNRYEILFDKSFMKALKIYGHGNIFQDMYYHTYNNKDDRDHLLCEEITWLAYELMIRFGNIFEAITEGAETQEMMIDAFSFAINTLTILNKLQCRVNLVSIKESAYEYIHIFVDDVVNRNTCMSKYFYKMNLHFRSLKKLIMEKIRMKRATINESDIQHLEFSTDGKCYIIRMDDHDVMYGTNELTFETAKKGVFRFIYNNTEIKFGL